MLEIVEVCYAELVTLHSRYLKITSLSRLVLKLRVNYPDDFCSQRTELDRITKAGGFVNVVGRINGNLNLSRSLGDMKYKQLFKLSRAEQVGTSLPFSFPAYYFYSSYRLLLRNQIFQ